MIFRRRACFIVWLIGLVWMTAMAPSDGNASSMAVMNAASKAKSTPAAPDDSALTVDERVSRMTDAEARTALIDTLAQQQTGGQADDDVEVAELLKGIETGFAYVCQRMILLTKNLPKVPGDLAAELRELGGGRPVFHFFLMALISSLFYGFGFAVEWVAVRWFRQFSPQSAAPPESDTEGWKRFGGALLFMLPGLFGLFLFTVSSAFLFLLIFGESRPSLRLFMLSFLTAIVVIRLAALISRRLFAPDSPGWRLVTVSDDTAVYLHQWAVRIIALWAFLMAFHGLLKISAMPKDSLTTIGMALGTLVLVLLAALILKNREPVARAMRGEETDSKCLTFRFAGAWHTFALAYLFVIWLFAFLLYAVFEQQIRGAFIMSLLIVPIYLALDRMGLWLVDSVIESFQKPSPIPKPKPVFPKTEEEAPEEEEGPNPYIHLARTGTRIIVFLAAAFWFMDIWGVGVAFAGELAGAALDIFLTVLIAYLVWVWGSRAIDNRILKSMKEAEALGEDQEDDEWGGAATQDRFYTLLPLFRKSLAVLLVVMVSLISLSAIGINIGPLLAGAGVVGLALGFGAQRLVRDILSGIFFLLDDTFRIGEYVDCGGVSGTVEEISLRMVKLRHHRGMLQFLPFGDIKQVTNSMRGGIVVKFNMQFPYDTDIDKVRKIIKKVGQKMMLDEKMGPDFIKPLKSQGVREIGDSVMTIRAKFTARPGAHFVIRREAYRRITEALAAKGIHYAHKKFIVDMPESFQHLLQQPVGETPLGKATPSDTPPAPPTAEKAESEPVEKSAGKKD